MSKERQRVVDRIRAWGEAASPARGAAILWLAALAAVAMVAGVAIAYLVDWQSPSIARTDETDWEPALLYGGLDPSEGMAVADRLSRLGVVHAVSADSTAVTVPVDRRHRLRLVLAGEGFPRSGRIGYEVADQTQGAHHLRALQVEIEKTLMEIEGVRTARVHLVPSEAGPRVEAPASAASVVLHLEPHAVLPPRVVGAVAYLVSASLPELDVRNVVVVDGDGDVLSPEVDALAEAAADVRGSAAFLEHLELQQRVEAILEGDVAGALDRIVGPGHSTVRISATLGEPFGSVDFPVHSGVRHVLDGRAALERLTMALTVDQSVVLRDPVSRGFVVHLRPQAEIDAIADLAAHTAVLHEKRGDRVTVFALPFDKSGQIQAREQAVADERREFWNGVAINVAKVLAILAAVATLRFAVQAIGRRLGIDAGSEHGDGDDDLGPEAVRQREVQRDRTEALLTEYGRELETAHRMQMELMPRQGPRLEGFDIAGDCRPAAQVGGDFFQYFGPEPGTCLLCVADVSGHGMEAAIPVVMFSGVLKSQVEEGGSPSELLGRLNATMHGGMTGATLTRRTFVCFLAAQLDPVRGAVRLANGGCPLPFYYSSSTGEVVELEVVGYPLGVRPHSAYGEVVLYSDGIPESLDRSEETFGFEATAATVQEACRRGAVAAEVIDQVMAAARAFAGDAPQADDMTRVVVRVEA